MIAGAPVADNRATNAAMRTLRQRRDNHWRSILWLLGAPISLRAGDRFTVSYRRFINDRNPGISVTLG